jgi:hypothetical protein
MRFDELAFPVEIAPYADCERFLQMFSERQWK